tara:strand:+ start:800 stop:1492 length:693 start_codon:yes stop_codon:yes gene_type:complete
MSKAVSSHFWIDALEISQAAGDLTTWPARVGISPTQPTGSMRPSWNPATGEVEFDAVGEALISTTSWAATGAMTLIAMVTKDSFSVAFDVVAEYKRYFVGGGWSMFFNTVARAFAAHGKNPNYQDAFETLTASGTNCWAMVCDSSLAAGSQLRLWLNGVELTGLTTSGGGAAGNYPAGNLFIGARDDGVGGLERPLGGGIRELIAYTVALTPSQVVDVSAAMSAKAAALQ